jgi:hypothetical protein
LKENPGLPFDYFLKALPVFGFVASLSKPSFCEYTQKMHLLNIFSQIIFRHFKEPAALLSADAFFIFR